MVVISKVPVKTTSGFAEKAELYEKLVEELPGVRHPAVAVRPADGEIWVAVDRPGAAASGQ